MGSFFTGLMLPPSGAGPLAFRSLSTSVSRLAAAGMGFLKVIRFTRLIQLLFRPTREYLALQPGQETGIPPNPSHTRGATSPPLLLCSAKAELDVEVVISWNAAPCTSLAEVTAAYHRPGPYPSGNLLLRFLMQARPGARYHQVSLSEQNQLFTPLLSEAGSVNGAHGKLLLPCSRWR